MSKTYNVYRNNKKVASGLTETTFTDKDLTHSTTYTYYVTVENEYGESEPSNTIKVTTEETVELSEELSTLQSPGQTDTTTDLEWGSDD